MVSLKRLGNTGKYINIAAAKFWMWYITTDNEKLYIHTQESLMKNQESWGSGELPQKKKM